MFKIVNSFVEYFIPSNFTTLEKYIESNDPKTIADVEKLMREHKSSTGLYQ